MPKVEEMIGQAAKQAKWKPRDAIANELHEGDGVILGYNNVGPIIGIVTKVELGGLETPEGIMPTRVQVTCQFVALTSPGKRLMQLVKVVNPASDRVLDTMMGKTN